MKNKIKNNSKPVGSFSRSDYYDMFVYRARSVFQ